MQHLASHRQLLTSLVTSLSQSPPPLPLPLPPQDHVLLAERHDRRRRLLLTLHVIFPSIVLPALDLLDRRLVMRVTAPAPRVTAGGGRDDKRNEGADGAASTASRGEDEDDEDDDDDQVLFARVHVVRSVASTLTRRGGRDAARAPSTWSRAYLVHLDAWSCSCAGFALEAFACHAQAAKHHSAAADGVPSSTPPPPPSSSPPQAASDDHDHTGPALVFGGMSADIVPGCSDEHVPCCKHLLACLLADKWGGLLGSHVEDRRATREELAGIFSSL